MYGTEVNLFFINSECDQIELLTHNFKLCANQIKLETLDITCLVNNNNNNKTCLVGQLK